MRYAEFLNHLKSLPPNVKSVEQFLRNYFGDTGVGQKDWSALAQFLIINKAAGNGIKIDPDDPSYGWHDMLGPIYTRGFGGAEPSYPIYQGSLRQHQFAVGDETFHDYHIPHDYLPGSDLFIHVHWSHNAAALISGAATWEFNIQYAKGHDRGAFVEKTIEVTQDASLTQYQHLIAEVQITNDGGDATHFDRNDIEVDGLILANMNLKANTLSDGAGVDPFAHYVDLHYQSTGVPTKAKAPDFWT